MEVEVRDNPDDERYELLVDGELAGRLAYRVGSRSVALVHTEVDANREGQGLASQLIAGALDDLRARGIKVVPVCTHVRRYLQRHPEYADLLA
jgi:predicted GNAT family acetyltransferase